MSQPKIFPVRENKIVHQMVTCTVSEMEGFVIGFQEGDFFGHRFYSNPHTKDTYWCGDTIARLLTENISQKDEIKDINSFLCEISRKFPIRKHDWERLNLPIVDGIKWSQRTR